MIPKNTALVVLTSITLSALMGLCGCHRPGRLVDLSRVEDNRTEEMIKAQRHMKRGEDLLDRAKASDARREFLAALEQYPAIARAHENLATIYEAEGDMLSATAEYIAYTELVSSRMYLERMFPYVDGKFSRNPPGPRDVSNRNKARAMVFLSRALDERLRAKLIPALNHLRAVDELLPGSGLVDYISGWWSLDSGDRLVAVDFFVRAAERNAFFAMRLLQRLENPTDELLKKLGETLTNGLEEHPSDSLCALSLASIYVRRKEPSMALEVVKKALSWGRTTWELLFLKAAAYKQLGREVQMSQALEDLKDLHVELSVAFSYWAKSIFAGLLGGSQLSMAGEELGAVLGEPARSYFFWRLFQEAGDTQQAKMAYDSFVAYLDLQYPKSQFENIPGSEPVEHSPTSIKEFRGAVRARLGKVAPALWQCDVARRKMRANPSGRLRLRLELGKQGRLEQVAIVDNSTNDPVMAYCVVRKLLGVHFPKPILGQERFEHTLMFGPEIDNFLNKAREK